MRGILVSALVLLLVLPVTATSGENEGTFKDIAGSRPTGSFPATIIDGDDELEDLIDLYNFTGNGTGHDPYVIEGLSFQDLDSLYGLALYDIGKDLEIRNCSFINLKYNAASVSLDLYESTDIRIIDCIFTNISNGIRLWKSDRIDIEGCEFHLTDYDSIRNPDGDDLRIANCTFKDQFRAISVRSSIMNTNLTVSNCKITDSNNGIKIEDTTNILISNVTIEDTETDGMYLNGIKARIDNCEVVNTGDRSVSGYYLQNGIISNCTLINGSNGVYNNKVLVVSNCTIESRIRCIEVYDVNFDSDSFHIDGNIMRSDLYGIHLETTCCEIFNNTIHSTRSGLEVLQNFDSFNKSRCVSVFNNTLFGGILSISGVHLNISGSYNNTLDGREIRIVNEENNTKIQDTGDYSQVLLHITSNHTIENLTNLRNVYINGGWNNRVKNCTTSNSFLGMSCYLSKDLNITGCDLSNHDTCIDPVYPESITISNNLMSDSTIAVNLSHDNNVRMIGNRMIGCSIYSQYLGDNLIITTDNTVNEKPVLYVNDSVDQNINGSIYGQIILDECSNTGIFDFNGRNSTCGLILSQSNKIDITGHDVENQKKCGISVIESNFSISGSSFKNCTMGMDLLTCLGHEISDCSFIDNSRYGLNLLHTLRDHGYITNNIFMGNGIGLNLERNVYSSFFHVHDNLFFNNKGHAIYAFEDSRIFNNTFLSNNEISMMKGYCHSQAAGFYSSIFNGWGGYGNYWSDHNNTDLNGDGFSDSRYKLDDIYGANFDKYPLTYVPLIGVPTNISLKQGNSNITLSINKFTETGLMEHTGFRIYRSTDRENWTKVLDLPPYITEFTDEYVWNGVTYYYKVTCLGKVPGHDWEGEGWRGPVLNETPDGTGPHIEFIQPGNGVVLPRDDVEILWTVTDNQDRLDRIEINIDGGNWEPCEGNFYLMEDLSNGSHSLGVRAFDEAGNSGIGFVTFTVDMDHPVVRIEYPVMEEFVTESDLEIRWSISDPTTEISRMEFLLDGIAYHDLMGKDSMRVKLPDGEHTLMITAWDLLELSSTEYIDFVVDTTAPYIFIQSPEEGSLHGRENIRLEYDAGDITSGMDYVLYKLDQGTWLPSFNRMIIDGKDLSHGEHVLELLAADRAGNIAYESLNFKVDGNKPHLRIISPENGSRINQMNFIRVEWEALDNESGVDRLILNTDGGYNDMFIEDPSTGYCILDFFEDGLHTIDLVLFDRSGNVNSESVEIFIDVDAPIIEYIHPLGNEIPTSSTFTVRFNEEMNTERTEIRIENIPCSGYWSGNDYYHMFPRSELDIDTAYSIVCRGYDIAGNEMNLEPVSFRTWKKGTVIGTVIDEKGEPIQEVFINITGENLEFRSNPAGGFEFNLEPGTYVIRFISEGFSISEMDIEVGSGSETIVGDVILEEIKDPGNDDEGSGGKWIVLILIIMFAGLISIITFFYIYSNHGKDESIELERNDEDYLIDRGSDEDEYVKHESNIERAKNDLW